MKRYSLLNRIIIKLDPSLFSLPIKEQEQKRLFLFNQNKLEIEKFILKEAFLVDGIEDSDDVDEIRCQLSDLGNHIFDSYITHFVGIGENKLHIPKITEDGKSLSDFNNLLELDKYQYALVQDYIKKNNPSEYLDTPYSMHFPGLYTQIFIGNQFHYAKLTSLSKFISHQLDLVFDELINIFLPSVLTYGKNHGKKSGDKYLFSIKSDNSNKYSIEQINKEIDKYLTKREEFINKKFDNKPPFSLVIINESTGTTEDNTISDEDYEAQDELEEKINDDLIFIFSNTAALENISIERLNSDTALLDLTNYSFISDLVDKEAEMAKRFIKKELTKILSNKKDNIIPIPEESETMMSLEEFLIFSTVPPVE